MQTQLARLLPVLLLVAIGCGQAPSTGADSDGGTQLGDGGQVATTDPRLSLVGVTGELSMTDAKPLSVTFHLENPKNKLVLLQALPDTVVLAAGSASVTYDPSTANGTLDGHITITSKNPTPLTFVVTLTGVSVVDIPSVSFTVHYAPAMQATLALGNGAITRITGLTYDAAGNGIISGTFDKTVDFGSGAVTNAGGLDGFVVKFAQSGALAWAKSVSSTGNDSIEGISVDAEGNIALVGEVAAQTATVAGRAVTPTALGFDGRAAVVASLTPAGEVRWVKVLEPKTTTSTPVLTTSTVAASADGHVTVGGSLSGAVVFGASTYTSASASSAYVAQLGKDGSPSWLRLIEKATGGSNFSATVTTLALDTGGAMYAGGNFTETFTPAGAGSPLDASVNQAYVARLDQAGAVMWAQGVGSAAPPFASQERFRAIVLAVASSGDALVAGSVVSGKPVKVGSATVATSNAEQMFIGSFSRSGATQWAHGFVSGGIVPNAIVAAGTSFYVGGVFGQGDLMLGGIARPAVGEVDGFVAHFDAAGALTGVATAGSTGRDAVYALAPTSSGGCVAATFAGAAVKLSSGSTPNDKAAAVVADVSVLPK